MSYGLLHPWLLILLPIALLPWLSRHRPSVSHPDGGLVSASGVSWAARLRWLPTLLRSLALAFVVVSLARPVKSDSHTNVNVEGVAIQLVVDRSSSMLALDFSLNGEPVDRLTALKAVVRDFVEGSGSLEGRTNDLVGVVSFARFADSNCPLTLDHDYLLEGMRQLSVARDVREDGTAIGDGVALGVERLKDVTARKGGEADESERPVGSSPTVKSRVMILLTDGENNAGDIDPIAAAELAQAYGIKLYTIGVGTRGVAPYPETDAFGRTYYIKVPVTIDEELLTKMAESTGGKYFRATNTDSLRAIYAEIDSLERSKTEARRYLEYADFAVEPMRFAGMTIPPLLLVAFLFLGFELLCVSTRWRTLT
ncbi:MAG: VWA domain-containing protein [Phycisphaerae bacterium]|nr:VWA domain-containing protein [Phycisphaerae bacterium]